MDIPEEAVRVAAVRVGVVLMQIPDSAESGCVIREDGRTVDFRREEETVSFSFDQAVTLESLQHVGPEILQPLARLVSCGYKGTLLIGGTHRADTSGALIDDHIVGEVLRILFGHVSKVKTSAFNAVSFVQFCPDDSAVDLLNPERRDLKAFRHPVLGSVVERVSEVAVGSAAEAYELYQAGSRRLGGTAAAAPSRSSFMFSVVTEHGLHTDKPGPEFCRGRLQLLGLAGGAGRNPLRGVSPLVEALERIQLGTRTEDQLLPVLLTDALTGNSMTSLLYCIPPQGRVGNEAPSALALAQRLKGLVTMATLNRWCPRDTERDLRLEMQRLREAIVSQEEHVMQSTYRLAELTKALQIVKDQSWEKRLETSEKLKNRIKEWQTSKEKWRQSGDHGADYEDTAEPIKYLQDRLRQEMEAHAREGKGSVEKVEERVTRMQQLRESLNDEMRKAEKTPSRSSHQLDYSSVLERRRRTAEDHERLIQEELEKMEEELKQDKAEGVHRELLVMARERRVLALQMEALRAEALQARRDLEAQHHAHQQDMQSLREESLKVFRMFHQVSEEQKGSMRDRYQSLLLEAIQDAVHLSAQNQQLQEESRTHRAALGELQVSVATRSETKAEFSSPQ